MTDIIVQLHAHVASDHVRGCMGRQYSCSCGYDAETEKLLAEAADEIERLRAEAVQNRKLENVLQAELTRLRDIILKGKP